jgi:hypothetical protein
LTDQGEPRVDVEELDLTRQFQKHFEVNGSHIIVDMSLEMAKRTSGQEITQDRVFYPTHLQCLVRVAKGRGKQAEDEYVEEERDIPFLIYETGVTRGWVPIPKTGRVKVGHDEFLVSRPMQYPFALDTKLLNQLIEGLHYNPHEIFKTVKEDYLDVRVDFSGTSTASYDIGDVCAIWVIGTHYHQAFNVFPYIKYEGPSGCGKTTANWTVALIAYHPILTPDVSDAGFYRIRELTGGTIAMDERDFKKKSDQRIDDLLNNAFTKGGFVIRNAKDEMGNIVPTLFWVFGPFSFSGVQDLPYMTETRTLMIPMRRTLLKRFSGTLPSPFDPQAQGIRNVLYMSRFQFGRQIAKIYDELDVHDFPLDTRGWDMARPLIAVAKVFAPDKIPALIRFVNEQVKEREGEASERGEIKVLVALSEIVKVKHQEETATNITLSQEFPLGLTAIKNQVLALFPDEAEVYWTARRIGKALRQLGFLDKKRSGSRGEFEYNIRAGAVTDWVKRLRLTDSPTEVAEDTEHIPQKLNSVRSVVQLPRGQASLDCLHPDSVSSVVQCSSGKPAEDKLGTEDSSSVGKLSSVGKAEQTEDTEFTEGDSDVSETENQLRTHEGREAAGGFLAQFCKDLDPSLWAVELVNAGYTKDQAQAEKFVQELRDRGLLGGAE